jgi:glycosyltransferase involved in cell wall biosynthesis
MEFTMAKISVVMTVYNGEKFLEEAIRSILEQTFGEFEFIIVDDGSTDRSVELIRKHTDGRIRFFPLAHVGRAAALNYAVSQTASPFIAIMDADDIALPHRLQTQFDAMMNDERIDVVSSSYMMIDEQGNPIREKHLPVTHEAIVELMPVQCSMCFPAAFIRKSILQKAGMFDEKSVIGEDYDLWLRILDWAKFYNISSSLIRYRISGASTSGKFKNLQLRHSYEKGICCLEEKYRNAKGDESKAKISLQLGKREYYNGTMANARRHLAKTLWNKQTMFIAWRYYVASLLGNQIFTVLRSTGLADRIGNIFRKSSVNHDYFMP